MEEFLLLEGDIYQQEELLNELMFSDLLRMSKDKKAPIAKRFQIEASFQDIDTEQFIISFYTRDILTKEEGGQGSGRNHTSQFQINKRLDKDKWKTAQRLFLIRNNKPALTAFVVNGFLRHGHTNFYCSCECFVGETLIKMLDGSNKRIDELVEGEKYWIYSSDENGNFVPKEATALGITKTVDQIVEVTLDNGITERCSLNHQWRLRDGSYKEAKYLMAGDSLMPLYTEIVDGYETVFDNDGKKKKTHTVVNRTVNDSYFEEKMEWRSKVGERCLISHHVDANKTNNVPSNLLWMGIKEHWEHHAKEGTERLSKTWKYWDDPDYYKSHVEVMRENGKKNNFATNPEVHKKAIESIKVSEKVKNGTGVKLRLENDPKLREEYSVRASKLINNLWNDSNFIENHKKGREKNISRLISINQSEKSKEKTRQRNKDPRIIRNQLIGRLFKVYDEIKSNNLEITQSTFLTYKGKTTPYPEKLFESFKESLDFYSKKNHKIVSVKIIDVEPTPLYDISVPDTENFALASGVYVHNSFTFGGFKYLAWFNKSNFADQKERRPPNKTNPNQRGICCKHLAGLVANIDKWIATIVDMLQSKLNLHNPNAPVIGGEKAPTTTTQRTMTPDNTDLTPTAQPVVPKVPIKKPKNPKVPISNPTVPTTEEPEEEPQTEPEVPTATRNATDTQIPAGSPPMGEEPVQSTSKGHMHHPKHKKKKHHWIRIETDLDSLDVKKWLDNLYKMHHSKGGNDHDDDLWTRLAHRKEM